MKLLLGLMAGLAVTAAVAQPYPRKPIQMLIPLQAASAVDNAARLVAQRMSENMGQQIVIENQPGAAGLIGTERVARAAPDGYLIGGFNDSIMTMLPNLHARMPWDILRDFEPVSLVVSMEWALVAHPGTPFRTAADVIAAAKARPGSLNYSSGGNGSPQHVAMELFKSRAGVFITHIPYRGATAAAMDAASGQVDIHLSGLPTVAGLVRGGKIKLLGVGSLKRLPQFPDAPTIAESGLPGFEASSWFAIFAPAKTPPEILAKVNAEVNRALSTPEVIERLAKLGTEPMSMSPAQADAFIRREYNELGAVMRAAGLTPQ